MNDNITMEDIFDTSEINTKEAIKNCIKIMDEEFAFCVKKMANRILAEKKIINTGAAFSYMSKKFYNAGIKSEIISRVRSKKSNEQIIKYLKKIREFLNSDEITDEFVESVRKEFEAETISFFK